MKKAERRKKAGKGGKGGFGYAISLLANMPKCHKMPWRNQGIQKKAPFLLGIREDTLPKLILTLSKSDDHKIKYIYRLTAF